MRASTFVSIAAALLAACASKPTVRTHSDPALANSAFRTYQFVAEPGTNRNGYSTPITRYFDEAIRREMDARGFRYAEGGADLLVNFNANARENVDLRTTRVSPTANVSIGYYNYRRGLYVARPMYADTSQIETVRYKVGTANVDVVDAAKKQVIWEGVAEGRLSREMMKNPQPAISAVITEMFAQFPAKAAP